MLTAGVAAFKYSNQEKALEGTIQAFQNEGRTTTILEGDKSFARRAGQLSGWTGGKFSITGTILNAVQSCKLGA